MHANDIISLIPIILLCLPSFAGVLAVILNALFRRQMAEWDSVSSVSVAAAVFIGWPLLLLAAVVGEVAGLMRGVSQRIKYAHYIIIIVAAVGTFALNFALGHVSRNGTQVCGAGDSASRTSSPPHSSNPDRITRSP